jgi:hypothetical protein
MDNLQSQNKPSEAIKTSGLAIASLILGIFGFCTFGLAGIVGSILGIVGLIAISKSAGQLKGSGLAIAGIIVSAVSLFTLFIVLLMAILMPALAQARDQGKTAVSLNNVRQLCLATIFYCDENEERFPTCDNWPDALKPYYRDPKILTSPHVPGAARSYAMNAKLNGRRKTDISKPVRTVLLFEARSGSPPAGGRELLPDRPRAQRGYIIGFVDSHVECVRPERLDELIWEP